MAESIRAGAGESSAAPTARRLAVLLFGVGILHFRTPRPFDSVIPARLPGRPRLYTHGSGVAELVVATALVTPRTRRRAGRWAAWLFLAIFPANVQMAVDWLRNDRIPASLKAVALARLPLQIPLVLAARKVHRAGNGRHWARPPVEPREPAARCPDTRDDGRVRTRYHDHLEQLADQLRVMCARNREAIAMATEALLGADLELAERTIDYCAETVAMREDTEHAAMTLLALEAPVAGELRRVVTALQLVDDLTRMSALTEHIARAARRRHPADAVPEPVRTLVTHMGETAVDLADAAVGVLTTADPGDAADLDARDDTMDDLHRDLLAAILADEWDNGTAAAVDVTLLGRYYERFADHAVEVGRRTLYMTTGHRPDDTPAHSG
ncbi:phosphate signaling complex protein PhoU [Nocardia sp. CY41]|uniref:phosphate signaling complex protein PhoU n=1 Tax=Nocardia sp. CY41 TaxID=2608686 RepID=UPI002E2DEA4B|nr:phosphate signaling complex protein PhoU [Nocardia sp. CY41]